jgi:hypothetical protein
LQWGRVINKTLADGKALTMLTVAVLNILAVLGLRFKFAAFPATLACMSCYPFRAEVILVGAE